jgi:ribosomal protein L16 Arg81 hydroxylase
MSRFEFSYLIAPHAPADFLARYWEQGALLIKAGEPDRFRALLPAANIEALLLLADQLPADAVELIGKANVAGNGPESARGLAAFFRNGSTIRVRGIQKHFEPLAEMCRSLEQQFGFPTRANLYCTPANSRGFDLHCDTHEVLVLQLFGKKRWQVHQPVVKLPESSASEQELLAQDGRGHSEITVAVPGPLELDELLMAGDSLYLPRGFFHQAVTLNESSAHLTIGIHVPPAGFGSAVNELAEGLKDQSAKSGRPDLESLDHETKLAGIVGLQLYFSADGSMAGLALGQEVFWMPVCFAPALRFVVERKLFCPRELPGEMTSKSKLGFVRRLVEDGFLRVC